MSNSLQWLLVVSNPSKVVIGAAPTRKKTKASELGATAYESLTLSSSDTGNVQLERPSTIYLHEVWVTSVPLILTLDDREGNWPITLTVAQQLQK